METLTETIDVIHIDAENRTIKMKSISKDASMYCDELGLSRINDDESSLTIRRHAGKADSFAGQLLPVPHGFILYLRGETYVVNGSGYIHAQEVLPNTDLGDEDISTTLPLDYVIEGHGPVEGKMVVQFFAPA